MTFDHKNLELATDGTQPSTIMLLDPSKCMNTVAVVFLLIVNT